MSRQAELRTSRAVPLPATVDPTEFAGRDQAAHADVMRLEAMIVGCVADHLVVLGQFLELLQSSARFADQRFLYEDMFSVGE